MIRLLALAIVSGIAWSLFIWAIGDGGHRLSVVLTAGIVTGCLMTTWSIRSLKHKSKVGMRQLAWCGLHTYCIAIALFFLIATPLEYLANMLWPIHELKDDLFNAISITLTYVGVGLLYGVIFYGWILIPLTMLNCSLVWVVYKSGDGIPVREEMARIWKPAK